MKLSRNIAEYQIHIHTTNEALEDIFIDNENYL